MATDDAITEARRLEARHTIGVTLHSLILAAYNHVGDEAVDRHEATIRAEVEVLLSATGAAEARGTEQVNVPDDGRLSKLCEREHWYRRGCPGLDDGSDYAISGDMAIDVADDLSAAIDLIEDERLAHQETRGAVAAWKQEGEKLRARVTALDQALRKEQQRLADANRATAFWREQVAALQAQLTAARAYMQHLESCALVNEEDAPVCTCGLDAALRPTQQTDTKD